MMRNYTLLLLAFLSALAFSCDSDDTQDNTPDEIVLPTTFNFENASYTGQTARILMLDSLERLIKTAHDGTTTLVEQDLKDIYSNASGSLFGSSKDLESKTYESAKATINAYLASAASRSGNAANIEDGRLIDENGQEIVQMVAKGLMGSVLYYQATGSYLTDDKLDGADNATIEEGGYTKMEHYWDEAYGYYGLALTYDGSEAKDYFWAKYADSRSSVYDVRADILNAFIAGRVAITNKDYTERNKQRDIIRQKWEELVAINAIHYINSTIADIDASESVNHHWSEAKAFAEALLYNPAKVITVSELNELKGYIGTNPASGTNAELKENLQSANSLLQNVYGFSNEVMLGL